MYESLSAEIERLHAEITTTEQRLCVASGEAHGGFLLDLLANRQRLVENKAERLALTVQKGESALARAELAARQLVAQAHLDPPPDPNSQFFATLAERLILPS